MNIANFIFNANTLVGVGAVIFAIAYVIKNFLLGTSKAESELQTVSRDLISNLEKAVGIEKVAREDCQRRLSILEKDMASLDGKLMTYKEILENRSPELNEVLNLLKEQAVRSEQLMKSANVFLEDYVQGRVAIGPAKKD